MADVEQASAMPDAAPEAQVDPVNTASVPSGWAVQVGLFAKPVRSRPRKTAKQARSKILASAGFTVASTRTARPTTAPASAASVRRPRPWNACNALKKKKIACYAVQQ